MTSTFHGLETSKRALFVNTTAMQTLGQNIANVNTEGYSRQRVNTSATNPIWQMGMTKSQMPGQLGTGVQVDSITRMRDSFLDTQYRRENQSLGVYNILNTTMTSLQNILNEPSDNGISNVMNDFWDSWEALNRDPSLLSARVAVSGAAQNLTDTLKHVGDSLTNLENDTNSNIDKKILEANNIADNIAKLNVLIRDNEAFGDHANDYRDQRDLLLDNLSNLVNITYSEDDTGMVTVTAAGVDLVSGDGVTPLTAESAQAATGGELYGYTQSLAEIGSLRNQLNGMVNTLVSAPVTVTLANGYVTSTNITALNDVTLSNGTTIPAGQNIPAGSTITSEMKIQVNGFNGLHQLGYNLQNPAETGLSFFTTTDGSGTFTIDNIAVNPDIVKNTNKIAASSKFEVVGGANQTIKGNSDIANALASLRDASFTFPSNLTSLTQGTTDDYFRALTSDLGIKASNTTRNQENQQDMVDTLQMSRQSVSGVNMDEELSDMIRFQQAYNAAARAMTTVDEMLDRVINQMGTVGR
ncbi:flagellar biosynthesis protein FlgK [Paenibacillus yonginensis]|uniref:Flagellar hook-associated protein 1 n=1 Tax=Paenibacillus yonginensis TaxID=1462996 RepID=A0A1B1N3U5_9BACL|nr:flagellar hook-associated protein FlgK [Paenibacillus yonginensis]ANS76100.1 flagellar biosynthesis protein FlgK [Paenibacillus yonginensis]